MNTTEFSVLKNIIGAVETGGQVYGKQDYSCYVPPYKNSPNEHTITLGAFSQYGSNAKKLIQRIYEADPSIVPSNIVSKLNTDWVATRWNPSSSEKVQLIKIISSDVGKKCQDEMFYEQVNSTIQSAVSLGVNDVGCQIMYVEIAHLGGDSAAKRIFNKTSKPYSVDGIFNTLMLDQNDTSNNNQVGDKIYQSRHEKVVQWIKQYLNTDSQMTSENSTANKQQINKTTKSDAINAMIAIATAEIGYLEKASNSQLDNKTANAGSANYTKYWRDIYPQYQGSAWCAVFVTWVFVKTFGKDVAIKLLKHYPYVYCPTLGQLFTKYANPQVGDIVIFWRNGEFAHTGIVIAVNGDLFTTIEGNTSDGSTIVPNGGAVCKKSYYNSNLPGTKFCRPDYSIVTSINSSGSSSSSSSSSSASSDTDTINNTVKWNGTVTADELNVRTWAGTQNKTCSFSPLHKGDIVGVCDTKKDSSGFDWYFIKYNDKYGFVSAKYVSKNNKGTTTKKTTTETTKKANNNGIEYADYLDKNLKGTYRVSASDGLNLRSGAGTNYKILVTMPNKSTVNCYGYYSICNGVKWYYLTYNGLVGFASSNYLKKL